MNVYKLTTEQKNQLINETLDGVQFFNPILDANGEWVISIETYNNLTLVRANELNVISWWFTLPEIDYSPVVNILP